MKIAFSGSHGTGKTTSTYLECLRYKRTTTKDVGIVAEVARQSPLPINTDAPIESQMWMFSRQLQIEIEFSTLYDILICDRPIADYVAYTLLIDEYVATAMLSFIKNYINTYDIIYFKTIENNQYLCYDGVRDIDLDYQKNIENRLIKIYQGLDYDVTFI